MISPYKVSTITATASLNTKIDLDVFFRRSDLIHGEGGGFLYIEYGRNKSEVFQKGMRKTRSVNPRNPTSILKRFNHQVSIVIRHEINGVVFNVNAKLFRNGSVHLTGVKSVGHAIVPIQILLAHVRNIHENIEALVEDMSQLCITKVKIALINADFKTGIGLNRDLFCKLMHRHHSRIFCKYEPCIYPGVQVQYNWNSATPASLDGICMCSKKCNGKGGGKGDGDCNRTTIAFFRSGSVILTGSVCMTQVDRAFAFAQSLMTNHRERCSSDHPFGLQMGHALQPGSD